MSLHTPRRRYVRIFKSLFFALVFTFLMLFLGFFGSLGYHVTSVKELSFTRYSRYAYGTFYCDILYNPILYPYYWFVGAGRLAGNFSMIVVAESYGPGEYGGPQYPRQDIREGDLYVTSMLIWGFAANVVFLFFIATFLEIMSKRIIYLVIFSGTIGFAVASIIGAIVSLFLSASVIIYLLVFNKSAMNFLTTFWYSLWE